MMGMGESERNTGIKVFDFFAGCGGASCGFEAAGLEVIFALDNDPAAKRTYTGNFPDVSFELADIREVDAGQLREHLDAARTSLVAVGRAETLTGADYYVAPQGSMPGDLEGCLRLEVSGVDSGSNTVVGRRLKNKLAQARRGLSDLPAIAGVAGFRARLVLLADLPQ